MKLTISLKVTKTYEGSVNTPKMIRKMKKKKNLKNTTIICLSPCFFFKNLRQKLFNLVYE